MAYFDGGAVWEDQDYYRADGLTEALLDAPERFQLLLGLRRMGKTSLLRRVEHRAENHKTLPFFVSLQGFGGFDGFRQQVQIRLEVASPALATRLSEVQEPFSFLGGLDRALEEEGRTLLLLLDEVEDLFEWAQGNPDSLKRLAACWEMGAATRVILAASPGIYHLEAEMEWRTSPFLNNFRPVFLPAFTEAEAASLVQQERDPRERPVDFSHFPRLYALSGGHPSVLQALCKQLQERPDSEEETLVSSVASTLDERYRLREGASIAGSRAGRVVYGLPGTDRIYGAGRPRRLSGGSESAVCLRPA